MVNTQYSDDHKWDCDNDGCPGADFEPLFEPCLCGKPAPIGEFCSKECLDTAYQAYLADAAEKK